MTCKVIDSARGWIDRLLITIRIKWRAFRQAFSYLIVFFGVSFVIYAALVNTIDPSGLGFVDDTSRPFWTTMGAVSAFVLVLIKPLWEWVKGDGYLKHVVVSDLDKTDMKQMAKFMKKAEDVTIYSGDFSYIYDHMPLYKILIDLAKRGNLTFISYKNKETVTSGSETKRGTKDCIINELIKADKMFFDMPGKAKFTLINRGGEEVFLYKHTEKGDDYVTVFQAANGMSKQLVETIKTLVNVTISVTSANAAPAGAKNASAMDK